METAISEVITQCDEVEIPAAIFEDRIEDKTCVLLKFSVGMRSESRLTFDRDQFDAARRQICREIGLGQIEIDTDRKDGVELHVDFIPDHLDFSPIRISAA